VLLLTAYGLQLTAGYTADEQKDRVEISQQAIEKKMPSYAKNLKRLIEEAERNIKKVEKEIQQRDAARSPGSSEIACLPARQASPTARNDNSEPAPRNDNIGTEKAAEKIAQETAMQKTLERVGDKEAGIEIQKEEPEEVTAENKDTLAKEHFRKGNFFYSQGKIAEAKEEWQKAVAIAKGR